MSNHDSFYSQRPERRGRHGGWEDEGGGRTKGPERPDQPPAHRARAKTRGEPLDNEYLLKQSHKRVSGSPDPRFSGNGMDAGGGGSGVPPSKDGSLAPTPLSKFVRETTPLSRHRREDLTDRVDPSRPRHPDHVGYSHPGRPSVPPLHLTDTGQGVPGSQDPAPRRGGTRSHDTKNHHHPGNHPLDNHHRDNRRRTNHDALVPAKHASSKTNASSWDNLDSLEEPESQSRTDPERYRLGSERFSHARGLYSAAESAAMRVGAGQLPRGVREHGSRQDTRRPHAEDDLAKSLQELSAKVQLPRMEAEQRQKRSDRHRPSAQQRRQQQPTAADEPYRGFDDGEKVPNQRPLKKSKAERDTATPDRRAGEPIGRGERLQPGETNPHGRRQQHYETEDREPARQRSSAVQRPRLEHLDQDRLGPVHSAGLSRARDTEPIGRERKKPRATEPRDHHHHHDVSSVGRNGNALVSSSGEHWNERPRDVNASAAGDRLHADSSDSAKESRVRNEHKSREQNGGLKHDWTKTVVDQQKERDSDYELSRKDHRNSDGRRTEKPAALVPRHQIDSASDGRSGFSLTGQTRSSRDSDNGRKSERESVCSTESGNGGSHKSESGKRNGGFESCDFDWATEVGEKAVTIEGEYPGGDTYLFYLQTDDGGIVGPLRFDVDAIDLGLPEVTKSQDSSQPLSGEPDDGLRNRQTGSHGLNEFSSRSHSVLTVTIDSETQPEPEDESLYVTKRGKLSFVDLAGSEKVKDASGSGGGPGMLESNSINKSLLVLGNCISHLGDAKRRHGHIPYRDSKLTKLLSDSLGGNGITLMIACITPSSVNTTETMNTLRYASRAKKIKSKPTVKMDPREKLIVNLKREIKILRNENHYLRQQLDFPAKPKGQLQKENDEKFMKFMKEQKDKETGLYEMLQEYMVENENLRAENSEMHSTRDRIRREQQLLYRENEKLVKRIEDMERVLSQNPAMMANYTGSRQRTDGYGQYDLTSPRQSPVAPLAYLQMGSPHAGGRGTGGGNPPPGPMRPPHRLPEPVMRPAQWPADRAENGGGYASLNGHTSPRGGPRQTSPTRSLERKGSQASTTDAILSMNEQLKREVMQLEGQIRQHQHPHDAAPRVNGNR